MIEAKKHLGQNFLISPYPVKDIVKASNLKKGDTVLEIGPGKGILTEKLLESGAKVVSIEKDRDLIPLLQEKFKKEIKNKKLTLIEGDILDIKISDVIKNKYKLVANIPYYITGSVLRKFLEEKVGPEQIVLLVQKEVAERIVAKDKKESILSISVKLFGDPFYVRTVSKGSFNPKPKVDSAILNINNTNKNSDKKIDNKKFFDLIHAGFAHKRKQLLPNLTRAFPKETISSIFSRLDINPKGRAEDLSLDNWLDIYNLLD